MVEPLVWPPYVKMHAYLTMHACIFDNLGQLYGMGFYSGYLFGGVPELDNEAQFYFTHELLSRLTLTGTVPYLTPHTTSTNFILANKAKLKKVAQGPPPLFKYGGGP